MLVLAESSKLDVVHCSQKRSGAAFFGQMFHRECECDEEGDAVRDNQRYESANRRAQPSCGRQRLAPFGVAPHPAVTETPIMLICSGAFWHHADGGVC